MSIKKFKIEITETLQRIIDIEANSLDDAVIEISEQYRNEKIVLDSSDYIKTDIVEFNPRLKTTNLSTE